jgi:hypothetical protein
MIKDAQATALRKARRARVFELRAVWAAGWDAIGQEVGVSGKQAKKDYYRACAEYGQESAAEHKAKANARFDAQIRATERLLAVLRRLAEGEGDGKDRIPPDLEAVARVNSLIRTKEKITHDQAQMNGCYAPLVIEHTGVSGGPIEVTLDDISKAVIASRANVEDHDPDAVH